MNDEDSNLCRRKERRSKDRTNKTDAKSNRPRDRSIRAAAVNDDVARPRPQDVDRCPPAAPERNPIRRSWIEMRLVFDQTGSSGGVRSTVDLGGSNATGRADDAPPPHGQNVGHPRDRTVDDRRNGLPRGKTAGTPRNDETPRRTRAVDDRYESSPLLPTTTTATTAKYSQRSRNCRDAPVDEDPLAAVHRTCSADWDSRVSGVSAEHSEFTSCPDLQSSTSASHVSQPLSATEYRRRYPITSFSNRRRDKDAEQRDDAAASGSAEDVDVRRAVHFTATTVDRMSTRVTIAPVDEREAGEMFRWLKHDMSRCQIYASVWICVALSALLLSNLFFLAAFVTNSWGIMTVPHRPAPADARIGIVAVTTAASAAAAATAAAAAAALRSSTPAAADRLVGLGGAMPVVAPAAEAEAEAETDVPVATDVTDQGVKQRWYFGLWRCCRHDGLCLGARWPGRSNSLASVFIIACFSGQVYTKI